MKARPVATSPRVTVVVTAYRSNPVHLQAAIDSARAQTWGDFELIVSDDSPDDRLRGVVGACADPRVLYRHNRPALGVARNHWTCFEAARGEFITILNHDDRLEPAALALWVNALTAEPQAVLAFSDHWVIDADGARLPLETERNTRAWGRSALAGGLHQPFLHLVEAQAIPMAMGAMFRRSALTAPCPPTAGPAYDLWLCHLLAREGGGAVYVPERLSAWRSHDSNLTSQAGADWLLGTASAWQAMADDPGSAAIAAAARRRAARWYYVCARQALRGGDRSAAVSHARTSWQQRPSWRGALVLAWSRVA